MAASWAVRRAEIGDLGNSQTRLQSTGEVTTPEVVTGLLWQAAGLAELGGGLESKVEQLAKEDSDIKQNLSILQEELRRQRDVLQE